MSGTVAVMLDTRSPQTTVDAGRIVEPPQDWVAIVRTDEDIGAASFWFVDPAGDLLPIGHEANDRMLRLQVPTAVLPGGDGLLQGLVYDAVGNVSTVFWPVTILRSLAWNVTMELLPAWRVEKSRMSGFDVAVELKKAWSVEESLRLGYEVEMTVQGAYLIEWTLDVSG